MGGAFTARTGGREEEIHVTCTFPKNGKARQRVTRATRHPRVPQ